MVFHFVHCVSADVLKLLSSFKGKIRYQSIKLHHSLIDLLHMAVCEERRVLRIYCFWPIVKNREIGKIRLHLCF